MDTVTQALILFCLSPQRCFKMYFTSSAYFSLNAQFYLHGLHLNFPNYDCNLLLGGGGGGALKTAGG